MPRANLTVTIPEGIWIGDISRAHSGASVRILAALTGDDAGVGLVEVTAPDVDAVIGDVADSDSVTELEVLRRHEDTGLLQFETTVPFLLLPIQDSGVPLTMPFTIQDGRARWEITAPQHRLSELGDRLDAFGIAYTVDEIRQHIEPRQVLTDRQVRLVDAAIELGYYDTPRRCTLTDVAAESGIAKSTCSETLHRAEGKIVKQFHETVGGRTLETSRP